MRRCTSIPEPKRLARPAGLFDTRNWCAAAAIVADESTFKTAAGDVSATHRNRLENFIRFYMDPSPPAADHPIAVNAEFLRREHGVLTNHAAGDRAARMAIATGTAVNLHIIQATQMAEGFEPCFGRASTNCDQSHCAYHDPCMSLVNFDLSQSTADAADRVEKPRRMPAETLVHPDLERLPRQIPAAGCGFDPVHDAR